ncbi:MAG: threonine--tRNA ligase [Clostridia bacterium]|nr:threonine--tRNA ligase [Clostridia bacterium]
MKNKKIREKNKMEEKDLEKAKELQQKQEMYRHSMSHVLAKAIKSIWGDVKLAIGPAIDNGFYYDIDMEQSIKPEDFGKIEDKMREIICNNEDFVRFELTKEEALEKFKDNPYKVELINELPEGELITMYRTGDDFYDLCRGPHVENTKFLRGFAYKINRVSGAYWRGSEKNKMLQRVYVYGFLDKNDLKAYIHQMEEALKRDHNKLGRELGIFTTVDYIGQGLPILLPKGARIVQLLQRFVEDEEQKRGWLLTKTPFMAKSDLYKISGHWDHYKDGMFVLGDESKDKEVFALRPMTCPFQYQAYLNQPRSYKDLPLRYNETSTLFRNEESGEMHGLIRVRQFTISEGHLMCTPDQLEDEFKRCLELAIYMLKTLGLYEDASYRFSQWDPDNRAKYIGTDEQWAEAQGIMKNILDKLEIPYEIGIGEAAFYGPKLDIQIRNVWGKEDTLITIQIDQLLAEKFGMEYTDSDGFKKNPYIIHRTSIGCYERTLAYLIEKYAGAFPTWLSPNQVKVITVSEKNNEYAVKVAEELSNLGLRVETDLDNESVGKKIRSAVLEKTPYILVLGDREMEEGKVAVRKRGSQETITMSLDAFKAEILNNIATKSLTV